MWRVLLVLVLSLLLVMKALGVECGYSSNRVAFGLSIKTCLIRCFNCKQ